METTLTLAIGLIVAVTSAWFTMVFTSKARRRERAERLKFEIVQSRSFPGPIDNELQSRFSEAIGVIIAEYRVELSNNGTVAATPRDWEWWLRDGWNRSYYYVPVETSIDLVRIDSTLQEQEQHESEEGLAFTLPAGSHAALDLRGLFVVFDGEEEEGPDGCAPRLVTSFRSAREYVETENSDLTSMEAASLFLHVVKAKFDRR